VVASANHDLPTLAGWWEGRDLAVREELGLFPDEETRRRQRAEREEDRRRLLAARRRPDSGRRRSIPFREDPRG
jgi:(1->4)-alpha-D-glucan 1-alpha-D-glucosylmutase